MAIREILIAIAALSWGCTPPAYIHDVGPDHPAGPTAPEGMLPGPSTTLAIEDIPLPEGIHHSGGEEASSRRGGKQAGEALYQCPMHPEVMSGDPDRRCPKCNMKINKPVKDGGSTPGHEGHGGHRQ